MLVLCSTIFELKLQVPYLENITKPLPSKNNIKAYSCTFIRADCTTHITGPTLAACFSLYDTVVYFIVIDIVLVV